MSQFCYVYMLQCKDGSLYTGWTKNLDKRLKAHNSGKGSKYTRARLPVTLVYFESLSTARAAMKREWQIKQMARRDKLMLLGQVLNFV